MVVIPSSGFSQHTLDAFQRLFTQRDLADVTLVCEDLTRFRAHSLILYLSSLFFASLLQEGSGQGDKVLYLGGLSRDQTSALVNLVYLGKAELQEHEVDQFSNLMSDFQVLQQNIKNGKQGLTKKEENPTSKTDEIEVETQIKSNLLGGQHLLQIQTKQRPKCSLTRMYRTKCTQFTIFQKQFRI